MRKIVYATRVESPGLEAVHKSLIASLNCEPVIVKSIEEAFKEIESGEVRAAILSRSINDQEVEDFLRQLRARRVYVPTFVCASNGYRDISHIGSFANYMGYFGGMSKALHSGKMREILGQKPLIQL